MWKQLLIFVFILVGLVAWDWSMTHRAERSRAEGVRIERLVDMNAVFTADRPVAAFRLDRGDGTVHAYVHQGGIWRCISAFGAIAASDQIGALLPKLEAAQGVIQTRDPKAAADFGFDTDDMLTLNVCGPDMLDDPAGDVIYALDIGHSIPGTGGSYVRPLGTDEIWAVNVDFRKELASEPDSMVPPMLDPHIVPAAWPGFHPPGVDRIVVETPGNPPLELQRIDHELTQEQIEAGEPPFHWTVKRGERTFVGDTFQVFSYGGFLMRAPYAGILGPHDPQSLGFDQPRGRITLRSAHGTIMQLVIGRRAPRGGVPVFNSFSGNTFEVTPDIIEIMLPEVDMLLFDHLGNPWEPFIRR